MKTTQKGTVFGEQMKMLAMMPALNTSGDVNNGGQMSRRCCDLVYELKNNGHDAIPLPPFALWRNSD